MCKMRVSSIIGGDTIDKYPIIDGFRIIHILWSDCIWENLVIEI